ncbi:MAG: PDZ domain-containing protein [Planctomycetes bacterium]|nr:PDZ domain-containing protein [Planctomycetota bacterium]
MSSNRPLIVLAVLGASILSGRTAPPTNGQESAGPESAAESIRHAKALSRAFRHAADRVRPSVVTVLVKSKTDMDSGALREMLKDPRFRGLLPEGFDPEQFQQDHAPDMPGLFQQVGSGVIVDPGGVILTNHHVIEDAESITVRLADGREFQGQSPVSDPMSDLAILRVQTNNPLPAARFGSSDELSIGDWVIAVGSPFELETTVSAGIISAKGRGIEQIQRGRLLQTDAAINPGNSGGALANLDGEIVGINTAIATSSGGYQGVGFAIPASRAAWVWRELADHGKVRRAYLGIRIDELNAQDAARFGADARGGVWVRQVVPDGAAAKSGMLADDIIVEFAGVPVRMPRDLQDVVEQSPIESRQPIVVLRNKERVSLEVTLEPFE